MNGVQIIAVTAAARIPTALGESRAGALWGGKGILSIIKDVPGLLGC
jgi:hypothetical protein